MKQILLLTGVLTLLTTTGCIVSDGGGRGHYHGHERYEHHDEGYIGPPAVVVRVPVVEVRPPAVIVH